MPKLAQFRAKQDATLAPVAADGAASILHVDMDAFFVSVELLARPSQQRGFVLVAAPAPVEGNNGAVFLRDSQVTDGGMKRDLGQAGTPLLGPIRMPAPPAARVKGGGLRRGPGGETARGKSLVLLEGIELSTSPLPRECSTTELQQRRTGNAGAPGYTAGPARGARRPP